MLAEHIRSLTTYQMIFTAIPLAFGILFLLLFIFFKRAKENLYFAIFLFFYSASIFFDYQASLYGEHARVYITIHRAVQPFIYLSALRFVYLICSPKMPKRFRLFAFLLVIPWLVAVYDPVNQYIYLRITTSVISLEICRVIIAAVRQKQEGAGLVAVGFFLYFGFGIFDALIDLDLGIPIPFAEMENPYAFGTIGFLIAMSIYLARRYARSHEHMLEQQRREKEQEMERRLLEVDNARKTRELEEARKLQLSMLPQCVNNIPGLDICFHMTPAVEVGGDYYDYQLDKDGSLVLAVGDATGHGMKAGIMVASIKSLFRTIGTNPDIPAFFQQCTATIKQMNMGNLFMGLILIRVKGGKLTASSAGMPPILVSRKQGQQVEQITIKGPPLGGISGFSYRQREETLKPGDALLLMSDGFAEQFNEKGQMMGYARAKEIFKEAAGREHTADEIVDYLCKEAEKWRNGETQEDDVTFVVLKFNGL